MENCQGKISEIIVEEQEAEIIGGGSYNKEERIQLGSIQNGRK